jgi:uncharacterized protein YgbK (DUF1537 family)
MQDLDPNPNGGLIVVGSHDSRTSDQLADLLENAPDAVVMELDVPARGVRRDSGTAIERNNRLGEDRYSSHLPGNALRSMTISRFQRLFPMPWLLSWSRWRPVHPSSLPTEAMTASEIATQALGIKNARVLGQILPGVPVWTMGNETRHPGLVYVIFPGNVGGGDELTQAYLKLK